MNIRNKLFAALLVLFVTPLGIVGFITIETSQSSLEKQIGMSSLEYARLTTDRINEYLYSRYENIQRWASEDIMMDIITDDENSNISRFLTERTNYYSDYYYLICLNKAGKVIAANDRKLIAEDLSGEIGFKKAIDGEIYLSDVRYSDVVSGNVVIFYIPIRDPLNQQNTTGVLCAYIKWEKINNMITALKMRGKQQSISDHIMLTNQDGLIISCVDPREMFRDNLIKLGMRSARFAKEGKEGYLTEVSEHGLKSFVSYTYFKEYNGLPNLGWLLVLLQDPDDIFASKELTKKIILLTMVTFGLILLMISFILANWITKPLLSVAATAESIKRGEWKKRVKVKTKDEIGALAISFNEMLDGLQHYQDELITAGEYVNNIIDNMNDSLMVVSETGNIETVNRTTLELLNYEEEEIVGKQCQILFGKKTDIETSQGNPCNIEDLIKRGQIKNVECLYKTRGGKEIPVLLSGSAIENSVEGTKSIVCVARDISERKRGEEILAAEKERLAVTLDSIGDGVITTDMEGRVSLINRIGKELIGWSEQEEIVGCPVKDVFFIIDGKTRERCENLIRTVREAGAAVDLGHDAVLLGRDGVQRQIAGSCSPIRDANREVIGAVLAFRDITEKLRMERELIKTQKLESVGLLAGGIAHDFNNILTGVIGNISYAKMLTNANNEIFGVLNEAEKAATQSKHLTSQLLTFSQGGAPIKKTTSIAALIKDMASFALRGSKAECKISIPDDLRPVDVDEGQISQVINNLIINADQAMPAGGVMEICAQNKVIGPGCHLPLKDGKFVRITVKDGGVGIPEGNLEKIFDPYFTTKDKGHGLGLASSYSIIQRHGGWIEAKSKIGAGSTFDVYLPASQGEMETKHAQDHKTTAHHIKTILFMDDNEMTRTLVDRALKRLEYEVCLAKDGSEVIDLFDRSRKTGQAFDVIVLDLTVRGGMGGKDAVQKLLEIDPEVKVVVSSGYSNDPIMADYKKYGFRGVLAKPYSIDELNRVLCDVVSVS